MVTENLEKKVHLDLNIDFDDQELLVEVIQFDILGNLLLMMLIDLVMLLRNLYYMEMDNQLGNNMDNQGKVEIDDNNLHQDPKSMPFIYEIILGEIFSSYRLSTVW